MAPSMLVRMTPDGEVFIVTACPICGKVNPEIKVTESDYKAWRAGAMAQRVFRDMPDDQREMLISGTCAECWDEMFKTPDDGITQ
jgi:hypothetical protein